MAENKLQQLTISKRSKEHGARRRWRQLVLLGIGLLLLPTLVQFWRTRPVAIVTASVSQIYPAQPLTLLNASGYVVAQRKAAVAAKITGRLDWLGVSEGSRVQSGQILARLDNREAEAALAEARAGLANARAQRVAAQAEEQDARRQEVRRQQLAASGFIAAAELDQAVARRERAEAAVVAATAQIDLATAALRGAEIALDNTVIRAPFDAVVLTKNADIGDIVTPLGAAANAKAAVVTIADLESLQVEADVSEVNLTRVRVGQPCEILLDAIPDRRYPGTLVTIVPTADRSKATVLVKVGFTEADPRILPEMSARVAFLERSIPAGENQPKTVLPVAALVHRDTVAFVYRLDDGRVRATAVTVGDVIGDQVEIRAGLRPGDKVALSPLDRLRDGRRVSLAEP